MSVDPSSPTSMSNQHVVDAMGKIPEPARFVMLLPEPRTSGGQTHFGVIFRSILAVNSIESVESAGAYFGDARPDFAFVQIDLQGLPIIEISGEPDSIKVELDVATLGFPMGEESLTPYDKTKVLKWRNRSHRQWGISHAA